MKLLDIFGTTSETFSLGLGEKKVDFRSIDGILHFRNFGTGWQKASSESLREALKLRSWSTGITIAQGEIFLHNNSLWYSDITLNTLSFEIDSRNFVKISDISNFLKINASDVTTDITLNSSVSDNIYVYGESSLSIINFTLPNAETLHVGRKIYIYNYTVNSTIRIYLNGDTNTYYNVYGNEILNLLLVSNNNATGQWNNLTSTGGNGGAAITNTANEITVVLNPSIYGTNQFIVGDIIYYDTVSNKWQKAYSSNTRLNAVGFVKSSSGQTIIICFYGQIQLASPLQVEGLTIVPGFTYYLTDDLNNIGKLTLNQGTINKKMLIAITSSTVFILNLDDGERFNEFNVYTLDDGQSVSLNYNTSNFLINGFIKDDSRLINFSGQIISGYPTEASIETNSAYVSNSDTIGKLCFFMLNNDLKMKNNLGSTKSIAIHKKKIG